MTTSLAVETVGALTLTGCSTTASPEEPTREAGAKVEMSGGTAGTVKLPAMNLLLLSKKTSEFATSSLVDWQVNAIEKTASEFGDEFYSRVDPKTGKQVGTAPYLAVDRMYQQWRYPDESINPNGTDGEPAFADSAKDRSTWVGKEFITSVKVNSKADAGSNEMSSADSQVMSWAMADGQSLKNMRGDFRAVLPDSEALLVNDNLARVHISDWDVDNTGPDAWAKRGRTWVYAQEMSGLGKHTTQSRAMPVQFVNKRPSVKWINGLAAHTAAENAWRERGDFTVQPEVKGPRTTCTFNFKSDYEKVASKFPHPREAWLQGTESQSNYGLGSMHLCGPKRAVTRPSVGGSNSNAFALWPGGADTASSVDRRKRDDATLTSAQVIVPALKPYDPLKVWLGLCSGTTARYGSSWK